MTNNSSCSVVITAPPRHEHYRKKHGNLQEKPEFLPFVLYFEHIRGSHIRKQYVGTLILGREGRIRKD